MFRCTFPYVLAVFFLPGIGDEPYGYHPANWQVGSRFGKSTIAHYYWFQFYDDLVNADNWHKEASMIDNFCIPSKRVSGPLFEVFVKYREQDGKAINAKKAVKPFNATGMTFMDNGFNATGKTPEDVVHSEQLDSLRSIYADLLKGVTEIQHRSELITERDSKVISFQRHYQESKEQNVVTVKELLLEGFQIRIDDQLVPSSKIDADFYTHPRHGERGMLCFFTLDSLAVGRHTFSLERRTENTRDLLHNTTTIPFMYEGR